MRAVIQQPDFLPWLGYFAKLAYADKFIVLDNIYFSKGKYLNRVQIINSQGQVNWISLPIGSHYQEYCNNIRFTDKNYVGKIIRNLHSSYSKARFFKQNIEQIEKILIESFTYSNFLAEINLNIIKEIILMLKIKMPDIFLSSQFGEALNATDRIILLCQETKTKSIIAGSILGIEIHDVQNIGSSGIELLIQDFFNNHPIYYQTRRTKLGFARGLSIVDCIFNEGIEKTRELLLMEPVQYHINPLLENKKL